MRQQINLYQPIFSQSGSSFSARTAAIALAVVAFGLAAFTVHANLHLKQLERSVVELRAQHERQQAMLTEAAALNAAAAADPAQVQARVKALENSLAERRAALDVLLSGAAGQTTGFADRIEALARRHVTGLWIERLELSGVNGAMTLSGVTLNADIVPQYLQSLAHEPVLNGARFDDFVIERPLPKPAGEESSEVEAEVKALPPGQLRFRAGQRLTPPSTAEAAS